ECPKVMQRLVHGVTLTTQKETRRAAPGTVSTICHAYASTLRRRSEGGVPTRHLIYRNHAFSARSSISIGNVILNTHPRFYAYAPTRHRIGSASPNQRARVVLHPCPKHWLSA